VQAGLDNVELHMSTLSTRVRSPHHPSTAGQDSREILQLYSDYLLGSIAALEMFAPKREESPVLSLYYDALSKGIQVSAFTIPYIFISCDVFK
jgi:hypothetical protein